MPAQLTHKRHPALAAVRGQLRAHGPRSLEANLYTDGTIRIHTSKGDMVGFRNTAKCLLGLAGVEPAGLEFRSRPIGARTRAMRRGPDTRTRELTAVVYLRGHHVAYTTWDCHYEFHFCGKVYKATSIGGLYAEAAKVGVTLHPYCG